MLVTVYSQQYKLDEVRWGPRKHFLLFKSPSAVYHRYFTVPTTLMHDQQNHLTTSNYIVYTVCTKTFMQHYDVLQEPKKMVQLRKQFFQREREKQGQYVKQKETAKKGDDNRFGGHVQENKHKSRKRLSSGECDRQREKKRKENFSINIADKNRCQTLYSEKNYPESCVVAHLPGFSFFLLVKY